MNKILILAGGYSNEREISLITAKSVIKELKKNEKYKFPCTILRPYLVYGPKQDFNRFIPITIKGCFLKK